MQRVHVDVSDLKAEPPRMSQNNMVGVAAVGGSVFYFSNSQPRKISAAV